MKTNAFWFGEMADPCTEAVAGSYLLKNGNMSEIPVYDQEAGIFITSALCLDLIDRCQTTKALSAYAAKKIYRAARRALPTQKQLWQLQMAVEEVNEALKKIGMWNYLLPTNVMDHVWCRETIRQKNAGTKRLLYFNEIAKRKYPEVALLGHDLVLYDKKQLFRTESRCKRVNFRCIGSYGDMLLLQTENVPYLFAFSAGSLRYLGSSPHRLGPELIVCDEAAYQLWKGTLFEVVKSAGCYKLVDDVLSLTIRDEYYGGGEQYCLDVTVFSFRKDEEGKYVKCSEDKKCYCR